MFRWRNSKREWWPIPRLSKIRTSTRRPTQKIILPCQPLHLRRLLANIAKGHYLLFLISNEGVFLEVLKTTAERIKDLKIQGATNVAIAALKALTSYIKETDTSSKEDLLRHLNHAKDVLFSSRATEPAMRNGIRSVIYHVGLSKKTDSAELSGLVDEKSKEFIVNLKEAKNRIAEIGAKRIVDGMDVVTHCHSSVVSGIFSEAWNQGKKFRVVCTETRPLYQGRITARELIDAGIPTTMVVDSAMRWVMKTKEIDFAIVGADAITSEGVVINKVGTRLLALAAKEFDVPFYVATPLAKFSPETVAGKLEEIEMRSSGELWENPPPGLNIENPAFETVAREYIDGLITEEGIFPPSYIIAVASQKHPFMFE